MIDQKHPTTGYVHNKAFLEHDLSFGHPESPERLLQISKKLEETGLDKKLRDVEPVSGESEHLRAVHSSQHISSVDGLTVTGGIARLAAASALGAVRDVCTGALTNAFCAIRPPGHHSHDNGGNYDGPGQGEGFCFYNNIAVAARYAQQYHGIKKVLIIDWDYHHGNGTEWSFYSDPTVLFFSTHEWYAYPGTGDPSRRGEGPGLGYNINAPLSSGCGDTDIIKAYQDLLIPAAQTFKPELVLVSAGFDSRENDPLGTFNITDQGFFQLTRTVMQIAETYCNGRLVSFLEGGYNVQGVASAAASHIRALLGE
ncbi:histone deacetylase [Fibrobacterota bacterium]